MVTFIIIAITVLISYKGFQDRSFFYRYSFSPYQVKHEKEYVRFLSHAFLHADWSHLFFNMFVLYMFGTTANEILQAYSGDTLGTIYYILLYLGGAVFATLTTYKKHHQNVNYHSIGASGAVSAVLFSYIIFLPMAELRLILFPFFGLPSVIWGVAYLVYEQYRAKKGEGYVNHDAHIAGALFGVGFTILTNPITAVNFYYQVIDYFN